MYFLSILICSVARCTINSDQANLSITFYLYVISFEKFRFYIVFYVLGLIKKHGVAVPCVRLARNYYLEGEF